MSARKLAIVLVIIIAALAAGSGPTTASAAQPIKLARVIYIIKGKACECTQKRCQAGDAVMAQVFTGARQRLVTRLDVSGEDSGAATYIQRYKVFTVPALLFLDAQGNLLWSAQGELSREEIVKKLGQLGG
ncbi:MAG: hypothetical protein V2A77_00975 [Pseudomonadota bacterium]